MSLIDTVKSAAMIGFGNSVRAVAYAIRRNRLDARRVGPRGSDSRGGERSLLRSRIPGSLTRATPVLGGARFDFEAATLEVRLLSGGGAFIGWDDAAPTPSYALTDEHEPIWAREVTVDREATDDADDIDGCFFVRQKPPDALEVEVSPGGGLQFRRGDAIVRRDDAPRWDGRAWRHRTTLDDGAVVHGFGGRSTAPDRRPGRFRLWNTDPGGIYREGDDPLSLTMPVYLVASDEGCRLAFYDNSFDGFAEVDDRGVTMDLTDGPLRYYVFDGSPDTVLERFTALTGRPALPPKWALGHHTSRWGYGSERVMRDLVEDFRKRDLPLSGIWMDIDHLARHTSFSVDTKRYPDLAGFSAELAEDDTHLVAIIDPAVPRSRRVPAYESGLASGVFCRDARGDVARAVVWPGVTVYPDFTSPVTRSWWGELYRPYMDFGVDGFWHDMNEPSAFAAFGDPTLPLSTRHDLDGRGGDHREAHNAYGLLMNRAGFEGLRSLRPANRPFLITRSGWVGMQRYAGTWSGDISTSWASLRVSLSFTLGLSMCGVPYSGPDIGGFDKHPSAELFARWFQLGSWLPFFRTHSRSGVPAREPWSFGEGVLAVARAALRDRYELLPYWYTLAWDAHLTGKPYIRPMWWADPLDRALRSVDDAFLLGDALLVAPVLREGVRSRTVRLPAGRWFDRRTNISYDGPSEITVPADLTSDGVPVFVRAGAVIPVQDGDRIVLEAYEGPASEGPDGGSGGVGSGGVGSGGVRPGGVGSGGRLVTDAGDGFAEPVIERFTVSGRSIAYDGPASELPYEVRWRAEAGGDSESAVD